MTAAADDATAEPTTWIASHFRIRLLTATALVLLATIPYLPTLRGPFFWDDAQNIEFNRSLRTSAGLIPIWTDPLASFQYYPLTYSLFWIEFGFFGERPFGFHVVSLALHAINALLVWRTLAALRAPASWWVAALFAVHPIQVETVGWISEQKNLLSTAFTLLALRLWEASREAKTVVATNRAFGVATIALIAALMAKTVALVLPFWIAVYEFVLGRRPIGRWLPRLSIWIVLGLAAGLVTSWRETATSTPTSSADTPPVLRFDERILLSCQSLWRYVGMSCCLEPFVPIPSRSAPSWNNPAAIASFAGVLVALWFAVAQCRRGRPWNLLGLALFAFFLGPTLGLVRFQFQCHSFVADHFAYLACTGLFLALIAAARIPTTTSTRVVGAVVLAMLTIATWNQSRLFAVPERLWRANIEANPLSWGARVNLADAFLKAGFTNAALDAATQAVVLEPSAAVGYGIVGTASAQLGMLRDAERAFRDALRLSPGDPRFHHNLANVLVRQARVREAIEEYRVAAERAPDFAMTHYLIGDAYRKLEMIPEAKAAMSRALEIDPEFESARRALESLESPPKNQLK